MKPQSALNNWVLMKNGERCSYYSKEEFKKQFLGG